MMPSDSTTQVGLKIHHSSCIDHELSSNPTSSAKLQQVRQKNQTKTHFHLPWLGSSKLQLVITSAVNAAKYSQEM